MNLVELNNNSKLEKRLNTDKNTIHSYLPLYDNLLRPIKNTATNILEVGVRFGGSIQLWHDYFPRAMIYGCDIQDEIQIPELKTNSRVLLKLDGNAYTKDYVERNFGNKKFDFLIDDGPHTLESQEKFIELYSSLLNKNGILIIEDVQDLTNLFYLKKKHLNILNNILRHII